MRSQPIYHGPQARSAAKSLSNNEEDAPLRKSRRKILTYTDFPNEWTSMLSFALRCCAGGKQSYPAHTAGNHYGAALGRIEEQMGYTLIASVLLQHTTSQCIPKIFLSVISTWQTSKETLVANS
jgi:hypothetical protein